LPDLSWFWASVVGVTGVVVLDDAVVVGAGVLAVYGFDQRVQAGRLVSFIW
jgi:hypothetical protein